MKRGLVVDSPDLFGADEWAARLRQVQAQIAGSGLDWALVYGDVSASDDISYLTNICIYWNEGVLLVPAVGDPQFVTRLSARVLVWMKRSSTVDMFHSTPALAGRIAEIVGCDKVGIVDVDRWPAGLLTELRGAIPTPTTSLDGLVSGLRAVPSPAEVEVLEDLGQTLGRAFGLDTTAAVELELRRSGCTDVLVDTLGDSVEIRAQRGHLWLQAGRDGTPLGQVAATVLNHVESLLRLGMDADSLMAAAASDLPAGTEAELTIIPVTRFGGLGEFDPHAAATAVVAVVVELADGRSRARASDSFHVGARGAELLTASTERPGGDR